MSRTLAAKLAPAAAAGRVVQQVAVVLEHGPAAGGVDDDGVHLVGHRPGLTERGAVGRGKLLGRLLQGGVVVQGPAAALAARDPDLAAVALQHAGGGQVRFGENGVGGAAGEQGHPRPPLALRPAAPRAAGRSAA